MNAPYLCPFAGTIASAQVVLSISTSAIYTPPLLHQEYFELKGHLFMKLVPMCTHPQSSALFFFIYCYKIFLTLSPSHPGELRAGMFPVLYLQGLNGAYNIAKGQYICLIISPTSLTHLCVLVLPSQSPTLKLAVNSHFLLPFVMYLAIN